MIVLTTPTGQIGRQVLDNIMDSTEAIRVITPRLSRRVRERAEVMQGSDDDIDVVTKAFTRADCVFWLVPPNPRAGRPRTTTATSLGQPARRSRARASGEWSESQPWATDTRETPGCCRRRWAWTS